MKHLLMITYPFPPNPSAGATRSERFARYIPEFGWSVDVVTVRPRLVKVKDERRLATLGKYVKVHQTATFDPWLFLRNLKTRGVLLNGVKSLFMQLSSFPDHMLLWVPFAISKAMRINQKAPINVIYTTSPPHSTHLVGFFLSRVINKPWVADFRDPWTLSPDRKKGQINRFSFKVQSIMEKAVLENASIVFANTKSNRCKLLETFPVLEEEGVVHLPNGWEQLTEYEYSRGNDRPLTIVHAGTFYPRFKPYSLLEALAVWRKGRQPEGIPAMEEISIILLGGGDPETEGVVNEFGLRDIVHVKPWVSLDEAREIMCQADLLWATLGSGNEASSFIPSKLYEYIAAKRPIVGFFPEGEAAKLIRETGTGIVFTNEDPMPIIEALHKARLACQGSGQFISLHNRREDVIASYHIMEIVRRLADILESRL
jgi:glycosyltransferase involved in cell wall biosynthesis